MLDLLIDNIFVLFGGRVFQQTTGIPMDMNCTPLLADICFYTLMRQTCFKGFSRIKIENWPKPLIPASAV